MQRGPGRARSVVTIGTAVALLGAGAASAAAAATGGAGLSAPAPTRVAAPSGPVLVPVRGIPQLSAGIGLRKVSRRAASAAVLRYASRAGGPLLVRVDVVRLADGLSIFNDERIAEAGKPQTVRWSGRAANGVALDGGDVLRVAVGDAVAQSRSSGSAPGGAAPEGAPPPPGSAAVGRFTFVGAVFPVRGAHDFGGRGARFGAGRAGHAHEGQDVMAACGTPLVAARGGTVIYRGRHSRAGNYLVIRDAITGESHMYAHLRERALVAKGQRVATGQQIGVVGDTGSASACHLHFELWTAPGWYAGGHPVDPLPTLARWDRAS
jgi:murein DD-endopeptidase MepM/ murein hydrolase activator NlpD